MSLFYCRTFVSHGICIPRQKWSGFSLCLQKFITKFTTKFITKIYRSQFSLLQYVGRMVYRKHEKYLTSSGLNFIFSGTGLPKVELFVHCSGERAAKRWLDQVGCWAPLGHEASLHSPLKNPAGLLLIQFNRPPSLVVTFRETFLPLGLAGKLSNKNILSNTIFGYFQ